MSETQITRTIRAPRARVYRALIDARAVEYWMVPTGMTSQVHVFEAHVGGAFRISLTYDEPTAQGKSSSHTDTYHGRFVELTPDRRVVQTMEFESDDPSMQGEMRVTFELSDARDGTELRATHAQVPPGVTPEDNQEGWTISINKLAELLEREQAR
jgi:uncharacterized protein YndB with AHSA1/START domain